MLTYGLISWRILTYGGILTYGSMLYVGSTTYVGHMTYVDIMDICWRMGECICWHMHSIMQYEPNTNIWTHTMQYEPYVDIRNNIAHYTSVRRNMDSNSAIWIICQNMKQYCTLQIHVLAYGLILSTMNYMSPYETILHIINPFVDIRTYIAQYKPYVDKWIIMRNMKHISTYKTRLRILNPYIWTHIAQYEPYVNTWHNIAHYKSICWHTELCCAIWTKFRYMKQSCVL